MFLKLPQPNPLHLIERHLILSPGVFSLGGKQLERAVEYVRNQKQQQEGTIISYLVQIQEEDEGPAAWNHGKALEGIRVIDQSATQ